MGSKTGEGERGNVEGGKIKGIVRGKAMIGRRQSKDKKEKENEDYELRGNGRNKI